jgi:lysophospholipase L1-like esterase
MKKLVLLLGIGCGSDGPIAAPTNALDAGTSRDASVVSPIDGGVVQMPMDAAPDVMSAESPTACLYRGGPPKPASAPDYDRFSPTINASCTGTNHQLVRGIEKVVFLGDSITAGTPPTPGSEFYRARLEALLRGEFGADLEVVSCAEWGAQTDDLMSGQKQLEKCFPTGVEFKKTLIVMTLGGNDAASWAKSTLPLAQAEAAADLSLQTFRDDVVWLKDPAHFPAGSYVVFANPYEFTDGTGAVTSCLGARLAGFNADWPTGVPVMKRVLEGYMEIAVDTQSDMMFLFEPFCGHGYKNNDPAGPCYRGPNAPRWFDVTCIHPTPAGHQVIANAFYSVIRE